jgi:capsid protein
MIRTREMYKDRQRTVAALVLNRLYYAWLRSFLRLSASGDYTFDADYRRLGDHEFQGRRWGWIEPTAEVNAAVIAVSHGWRTDAEVAAEYGNDIDDNITEARRLALPKMEAGLVTVGNGLGSQTATADSIVLDTNQEATDGKEEQDAPGAQA